MHQAAVSSLLTRFLIIWAIEAPVRPLLLPNGISPRHPLCWTLVGHPSQAEMSEWIRGSLFKFNRSQAVRLPKSVVFPDDVRKVDLIVLGNARLPAAAGQVWTTWFDGPAFPRTSWLSAISRSTKDARHCRRPCGTCLIRRPRRLGPRLDAVLDGALRARARRTPSS